MITTMKRIIITIALILTKLTICQAQNNIPKTVDELRKWEKAMIVKANEGDADACRLLAMSNMEKYGYYGQRAIEIYQQQATGEAYYHMAELYANDIERRDSLLLLASQQGYAQADKQIEALKRSQQLEMGLDEYTPHVATALSYQPMRDIALNIELERTPEEAKFFMETAQKYQNINHRREAIWYYDLAFSIDPRGCSSARNKAEALRTQMRQERQNAHYQLQQEQIQREINSQQWAALANAASELAATLQRPRSGSSPSYAPQSTTFTRESSSHSNHDDSSISTNNHEEKLKQIKKQNHERELEKAKRLGTWNIPSKKKIIMVDCRNCKGTGKVPCSWCKGKTRLTCPGCNGLGYPPGFKKRICTNCNGKQTVKCQPCYGKGTEKCMICNGSGKIEKTVWE